MSLTFSLLKPPLTSSTHHHHQPHKLSSNGSSFTLLPNFSTLSLSTPHRNSPNYPFTFPVIKAMKSMQGKVVCATSDKTVAVEVTRLAPHPKYKRRVRKKKKYQAHDPDNQFKVGDWVQLEKCRPISKTKTFLAIMPTLGKNAPRSVKPVPAQLDVPVQSQQE